MFFTRRARIGRRLTAISAELHRLRGERAVLAEQVQHLEVVEADTTTDSVVSDTPAASRELNLARTDLKRAQKARDAVEQRIADLTTEQDELLEKLIDEPTRHKGRA